MMDKKNTKKLIVLRKMAEGEQTMMIVMTVNGDGEARVMALAGRTKDSITLIMA